MGVWVMGDIMIIFLASLLDVPRDLYEAASLDGANGVQQVRHITLPTIAPVIGFAVVTGVIAALQYFTEAAVASGVASGKATIGGGPRRSSATRARRCSPTPSCSTSTASRTSSSATRPRWPSSCS
ncbi:ABC transporter permease subunit [Curtobacterium flaccumfaciens]|nr:ABC transporter permease subunit [Curtobacterium flaccumfaciens]